jgi:uncharacterized protein YbjT (DUF2867 family)
VLLRPAQAGSKARQYYQQKLIPFALSNTPRQNQPHSAPPLIILAGATGELGHRIARQLHQRGARVRALVRVGSTSPVLSSLRQLGAEIVEVDFNNITSLTPACAGGTCVVSALSGLREVIVGAQTRLLKAAVAAAVPRFIPSDYCIDYTRLPAGSNRNLDLRREFAQHLDQAPIAATSILNGMFTDLLTGPAPLIQFGLHRVLYWGDADQPLDFSSMDDTAAFTAAAALDPGPPRFLRVAGEVASIRGLQAAATAATGQQFRLFRVGSLPLLATRIKLTRTLFPQRQEVFPAWQGMQYLHNMLSGRPKLAPLDNARYPDLRWTPVREVLAAHPA